MSSVSVIIPTYNRLDRLKHVVHGLEQQSYPLRDFDVIIISDGSTDGTHAYLHSLATSLRLTVTVQANQGPAAARNHGVSQATGEFVLFIDDDVVPTPHLVAEHMRVHAEQSRDVVVLGPMLTPADFTMLPWVRWEQDRLAEQYEAMQLGKWQPTARQFYTGNASLARRHILALGGFDETFRRAEDVELAYRLAQRDIEFIFNPAAIGYHYAERSFRSWMETPYAYGRNDVIFTRDKEQTWLLPIIQREFRSRNPLIKVLVRMCLDRYGVSKGVLAGLKHISELGVRLRMDRLSQAAYSGIFQLRYYQGIADELGGRHGFLA